MQDISIHTYAVNLCRGALARFAHLAANLCCEPRLHTVARECARRGDSPAAFDLMVAAHDATVAAHRSGNPFATQAAAQAAVLATSVKVAFDMAEYDPHVAVVELLRATTQANDWAHQHETAGRWAAWEH